MQSGAINTFIPALAYTFSGNPTEVGVRHEERHAGVSNYTFYMLVRLNFDLITGFSLAPLQYFTMFALACSAGSFVLVLILAYYRIFLNGEPRPYSRSSASSSSSSASPWSASA